MPGWGRFLTPDPGASADASNPGSWNRYAYVQGDPVNIVDPFGLEGIPTGCLIFGQYRPDCDMYLRSAGGFQEYIQPAPPAFARLSQAQETFSQRTAFSDNCRNGLAKVTFPGGSLTPEALVSHSANITLADGTQTGRSISAAYGDAGIGNAAQYMWNTAAAYRQYRINNNVANMAVKDVFAAATGIQAWTPYGGETIYIDAGRPGVGNTMRNQALIMHEVIHDLYGLDDVDMMNALGISKAGQQQGFRRNHEVA